MLEKSKTNKSISEVVEQLHAVIKSLYDNDDEGLLDFDDLAEIEDIIAISRLAQEGTYINEDRIVRTVDRYLEKQNRKAIKCY